MGPLFRPIACILLCLVFFQSTLSRADETLLNLNPLYGQELVGPNSRVWVDEKLNASLQDAIEAHQSNKFRPEIQVYPNYGFTGKAYWFVFKAKNQHVQSHIWYFGLEYPLVDYIDIYYESHGNWAHKTGGDRVIFEKRDLKNRFFYFAIPFEAHEAKVFYVRVQTEGSSEFRFLFRDLMSIYRADHDEQFFQGAFAGLLAIMCAYYFLMALGSRTPDLIFFTIYLIAMFIFRLALNGFAFEYIWPRWVNWANVVSAVSVPFVFGTGCLSAYVSLPIRSHPKMRVTFKVFIVLLFGGTFSAFFLPYSVLKIFTVFGMMTSALIILASLYVLRQGFSPARYFVFAWTSLLMGSIVYGGQKLGLLPVSFWTIYGVELSIVCQVILLALGTSAKLNETNLELQRAQKQALEAQIEANRLAEVLNHELEQQVQERTQELWDQTKSLGVMLDNINQGICTIDGNGQIQSSYSRYLESILGCKHIAGRQLDELLFLTSNLGLEGRSLLRSFFAVSCGENSVNFEMNHHLLPRAVKFFRGEDVRDLELDWAAIESKDAKVQKILVAIRDVSEEKRIVAEAAAKQRELEAIGRILDQPASSFLRFIECSKKTLDECDNLVKRGSVVKDWPVVLRSIHTIKGNSRTYGLSDLSQIIHEMEDKLFALDITGNDMDMVSRARSVFHKIGQALRYYEDLFNNRLNRGVLVDKENLIVQVSRMIQEIWSDVASEKRQRFRPLLQKIDEFNMHSFRRLIERLERSLPELANKLNKRPPQVIVKGMDFYIEHESMNAFEEIFVHLIRNSLDHGFLPGQDHRIAIQIEHTQTLTTLIYEDDGIGLNLPVIREKALEKGLIAGDADDASIAQTIFQSGVTSTKDVNDVSGRGVGMDAAIAAVTRLHGHLELELLDKMALGRRTFRLIIQFPKHDVTLVNLEAI